MKPLMVRGVGLVLCGVLSGCSLLSPVADQSQFFVLSPLPETTDTNGAAAAAMYGLGPIRLPSYLERGELATRVSPTQIQYSDRDYWAEPLADNVGSVLLSNLTMLLGTDRIVVYPWSASAMVDYQIQITFLRFESDPNGDAQLRARWSVVGAGGPALTRDAVLTQAAAAKTPAASAAALSAALGAFSEEIAVALRGLPTPAPAHHQAR